MPKPVLKLFRSHRIPRAARTLPALVAGAVVSVLSVVSAAGLVSIGLENGLIAPQPERAKGTPVVFVPGVTGTKLRDPSTGELVWGASEQLMRPRDGGYRIVLPLSVGDPLLPNTGPPHPQARYEAVEPIWQLRFVSWNKMIYRPLLERFELEGYRLGDLAAPRPGDSFFFFNYDWRYGNLESVGQLDRQLEALSASRGGIEVDLICQSNAAKICRWLAKYGSLTADSAQAGETWRRGYGIRKILLVGASNSGALRVLQLLTQGRRYVPLIGRQLYPETFFSIRPLFEDLPTGRKDLFFDVRGRTLDVDLFDPRNWPKYGWSIFSSTATERLRREPRSDLFGDREAQFEYLRRQLTQAGQLQKLLQEDSDHFPSIRYYRLENDSSPTIDRALLLKERGHWKTYFLGDSRVDRDSVLKNLASAPGDGHAVLGSQRGLSPQETAALVGTKIVDGGHFDAVIQPAALDALLEFLAEPVASDPEGPAGDPERGLAALPSSSSSLQQGH